MQPIYLDHAATTPLDPRVGEAMLPWLDCANPSSQHAEGRRARMAIDEARETLAGALNCMPGEIVFTSSGTEAANLAICGVALANRGGRNKILLGSCEHHCVLNTAPLLCQLGFDVRMLPCTKTGAISTDAVKEALDEKTLLVSVMHANNETGVINDVEVISAICRDAGAIFFCDAVQTFGLLPVPRADLVAVSAHKLYGPKGAGALYMRAGIKLFPLIVGGGQEREMRAGTENVAAIVGFAQVVKLAIEDFERAARIESVRNTFVNAMRTGFVPRPMFTVTNLSECLPTHAHLRFPGLSAEVLLIVLDRLGVYASSGAACSSGSIEPSHVLLAAGFSEKESSEGLRFTFGKDTTHEDARNAAAAVAESVSQVIARR